MNSLYGAVANQYFIYFIAAMAEAITTSGQLSVKTAEKYVNEYLNKVLGADNVDYTVYMDTDSVVGSTKIVVNEEEKTIEDFYNSIVSPHFIKRDDFNEDYIIDLSGNKFLASSVNINSNIETKPIKYIMKHKVKKRLYKISLSNGKSVTVTEDHSIVAKNKKTGKLISIPPYKLDPEIHFVVNAETQTVI